MMLNTQTSIFHLATTSIIEIHHHIENVFTKNNPLDLEQLLEAFHPDFQMITMTGHAVKLDAVKELFSHKQGSRPNLKIDVSNIQLISEDTDKVWLQYQETHHENGDSSSRLSTVCIVLKENETHWFYLHETAI